MARATIAAAKRNLHPSLAELRTNAFDEALARAQDAPEPPAKGKKGKKETSKGDTDSAALKEARARSDAAANAVVLSAVAKGVAAGVKVWGEGELGEGQKTKIQKESTSRSSRYATTNGAI